MEGCREHGLSGPDVSSITWIIRYQRLSFVDEMLLTSTADRTWVSFFPTCSKLLSPLLNALLRFRFLVAVKMSGSEHYPQLSYLHRWLAVQFCSSVELNPEHRFLRSKEERITLGERTEIFSWSVFKGNTTRRRRYTQSWLWTHISDGMLLQHNIAFAYICKR